MYRSKNHSSPPSQRWYFFPSFLWWVNIYSSHTLVDFFLALLHLFYPFNFYFSFTFFLFFSLPPFHIPLKWHQLIPLGYFPIYIALAWGYCLFTDCLTVYQIRFTQNGRCNSSCLGKAMLYQLKTSLYFYIYKPLKYLKGLCHQFRTGWKWYRWIGLG
jgi:hypothetical protein